MDAFTHFFVSLALWNILLATLAFLFGLLMGHWMWGQFKSQLAKAKTRLAESEKEVALYADDTARLRDLNREQEEEINKDKDSLSTELKASRVALEETKIRALDAEKEVAALKEKSTEVEKSLSDLKAQVKELTKERDEAVKNQQEAEKKSSKSDESEEEWTEEKGKLKSQLSKEKSASASLREVITDLNDRERELKKKLETLEEELSEKEEKEDSSKD